MPLLLHGARTPTPADIAVIEGVMGLFDGQIGGEGLPRPPMSPAWLMRR